MGNRKKGCPLVVKERGWLVASKTRGRLARKGVALLARKGVALLAKKGAGYSNERLCG